MNRSDKEMDGMEWIQAVRKEGISRLLGCDGTAGIPTCSLVVVQGEVVCSYTKDDLCNEIAAFFGKWLKRNRNCS